MGYKPIPDLPSYTTAAWHNRKLSESSICVGFGSWREWGISYKDIMVLIWRLLSNLYFIVATLSSNIAWKLLWLKKKSQ